MSISGTFGYLFAVFGISETWYFEVSMSGTFGYLLVVFELPKSGNFEVSISGAFEYPQPVIHYIGIYSKRKWMKDKYGYGLIYIYMYYKRRTFSYLCVLNAYDYDAC